MKEKYFLYLPSCDTPVGIRYTMLANGKAGTLVIGGSAQLAQEMQSVYVDYFAAPPSTCNAPRPGIVKYSSQINLNQWIYGCRALKEHGLLLKLTTNHGRIMR